MRGKNKIKSFFLIMICIFIASTSSGCFDRVEIDDLAYVLAIGLDKGTTNILRMTLQLAVPLEMGGGSSGGGESGGGGGGESSAKGSLITVLESPTIYSGLNMANNYISKELNLSHAKIFVFSEELAREGIEKYLHAITRGKEFRPNMYIAVARGTAEDYIRNSTPKLANPSKFYEQLFRGYEFTAFGANTQLINFYLQEESTYIQAVASLAGVNKNKSTDDFDLNDSTYSKKGRSLPLEGDYIAGMEPKIGDVQSEIMGLAVFKGDKMVGELDGEETSFYLMVTNNYTSSYMTIPDPLVNEKYVVLDVKRSRKTVVDVNYNGGKPLISVVVRLEADILSIQSGKNYESADNMKLLEGFASDFIKKGIERYLEKTLLLKSDINGFGKKVKSTCLTWDEWLGKRWMQVYENSSFDVEVDLKVRRTGLMIRTVPSIREGE